MSTIQAAATTASAAQGTGWLDADVASIAIGVWVVVVVVYAFYRSTGEARTDPIRASGPWLD